MCQHGDTVILTVPIPACLSHTGRRRIGARAIDRCLAPIVAALNAGGVPTASSCCGYGQAEGCIWLEDGRTLILGRWDPAEKAQQGVRNHQESAT